MKGQELGFFGVGIQIGSESLRTSIRPQWVPDFWLRTLFEWADPVDWQRVSPPCPIVVPIPNDSCQLVPPKAELNKIIHANQIHNTSHRSLPSGLCLVFRTHVGCRSGLDKYPWRELGERCQLASQSGARSFGCGLDNQQRKLHGFCQCERDRFQPHDWWGAGNAESEPCSRGFHTEWSWNRELSRTSWSCWRNFLWHRCLDP